MKQSKWSFPCAHDKGIWGRGGTGPLILNLGTGWSGSCQGKSFQYWSHWTWIGPPELVWTLWKT